MKNSLALFFTGLGIGVLLGLSDSPVLVQILVPLFTIIVTLVSILSGIKSYETSESKDTFFSRIQTVNIVPTMLLVIGITSGAILGIYVRTHNLLSPPWVSENPINIIVLNQVSADSFKISSLNKSEGIELVHELRNSSNSEVKKILGLEKTSKSKENAITKDESKKSLDIPKNLYSVLNGSQSDQDSSLCSIRRICEFTGVDLVAVLRYSAHSEIKPLLKSPINTDSLKSKINRICKCKN